MSDTRLVLLSCCAPCSSGAIKQLAENKIDGVSDFIVLFYNPNIFPESEYTKRMQEQIKYFSERGMATNSSTLCNRAHALQTQLNRILANKIEKPKENG